MSCTKYVTDIGTFGLKSAANGDKPVSNHLRYDVVWPLQNINIQFHWRSWRGCCLRRGKMNILKEKFIFCTQHVLNNNDK